MIPVCQPLPHGVNPNDIIFALICNIRTTVAVLFCMAVQAHHRISMEMQPSAIKHNI